MHSALQPDMDTKNRLNRYHYFMQSILLTVAVLFTANTSFASSNKCAKVLLREGNEEASTSNIKVPSPADVIYSQIFRYDGPGRLQPLNDSGFDIALMRELPFDFYIKESVPSSWKEIMSFLRPGVVETKCPDCPRPDDSRLAIAILVSRAWSLKTEPGTPIDLKFLDYQARLLQESVKSFTNLYRLDWRDPNQILKDSGFKPNKEKPSMTLWEHVYRRSTGGGNLVSLTAKEINNDVVNVVLQSKFDSGDYSYGWDGFRKVQKNGVLVPVDIPDIKLYEYSIQDAQGIATPERYGASGESEIVTPQVDISKVKSYREIVVQIEKGQITSIERSPWKPIAQ